MTGQQADPAARWALVCSVLDAVLDAPEGERQRILDKRCAGDPALRDEVAALLQADTAIDDKLETPLFERAGTLFDDDDVPATPADPPPGETIGPWRLIEELGRGGMGAVWLAERADGAFEHRVALKLLKRGLDSDAILERFLAERQILARLQHPHIAHLVDGGVAADGRPYFAMERVEGEPITRWCDARHLPVRERLELFLAVTDAVQYAHRQLVVHRDLKPSNILVTPQGEAKLLDFGIAKLLDADADRAEAQTLTQLGIRMLTPEYAAPEQLRGDAVTTATDVYALGVLLHELLSGQRPPPAEADPAAAKSPPRPSTRVTDVAAETRGTTRERLQRALRGDLDTIVLRAMHPAPERRYGSAEALGADIRRHLDRQPVDARPDSFRYRAGKFIARNRLAVAAAALVAFTLVGGIVATTWQAREARQQTRRAEQVKDFLVTVFEAGSPQEWRGKEPTARELLDAGAKRVDAELSGDPALHAEMLAVIGSLYMDQAQYDSAETLLKRSLAERRRLFGVNHEAYADSLGKWSSLLLAKGDGSGAERAAAQAVEILRRKHGNSLQMAEALDALSRARLKAGDIDGAIRLRREALGIHRQIYGNLHANVADALHELGSLLVDKERYEEAAPLFDESVGIYRRLYGARSVRYATAINAQAMLSLKQGEIMRAARAFNESAGIYRHARDQINLEDALNHYGAALCQLGRFREAEQSLRESLELAERNRVDTGWIGMRSVQLGGCLADAGHFSAAEPLLRKGLDDVIRDVGEEHGWTPYALSELAESLAWQGRTEEASLLVERARALFERIFGPDNAWTADSMRIQSGLQFAAGNRQQGLALALRALETQRRIHGPRHPRTAVATLNLAHLELRAGKAREAADRLRDITPVIDAIGDQPGSLTARMLRGMALDRLNEPEGEKLLRDAVSGRRKLYGDGNARTAEAEAYLGASLIRRGRLPEGRLLLERAQTELAREANSNPDALHLASEELGRLH